MLFLGNKTKPSSQEVIPNELIHPSGAKEEVNPSSTSKLDKKASNNSSILIEPKANFSFQIENVIGYKPYHFPVLKDSVLIPELGNPCLFNLKTLQVEKKIEGLTEFDHCEYYKNDTFIVLSQNAMWTLTLENTQGKMQMINPLNEGIICFAIEQDIIVAGHEEGKIFVWNLAEGKLTQTFEVGVEARMIAIALFNQRIYACVEDEGYIVEYDFNGNKQKFKTPSNTKKIVLTDEYLICPCYDEKIHVWDLKTRALVNSFSSYLYVTSLAMANGFLLCVSERCEGEIMMVNSDGQVKDGLKLPDGKTMTILGMGLHGGMEKTSFKEKDLLGFQVVNDKLLMKYKTGQIKVWDLQAFLAYALA